MTQTNTKDALKLSDLAEAAFGEAAAMEEAANKYNCDNRYECLQRALEAYAHAGSCFNRLRDRFSFAQVEQRLGQLYFQLHEISKADIHIRRAHRLFTILGDRLAVALTDALRAQIALEQGKFVPAQRLAGEAAESLERLGKYPGGLVLALITRGRALARMGNTEWAISSLRRAYQLAQEAKDLKGAGVASLALIEELHTAMTVHEMQDCYSEANELLQDYSDFETLTSLTICAQILVKRLQAEKREDFVPDGLITPDKPISLVEEVNRFEGELVRRAMEISGNRVLQASRMLGLKNHQTLLGMLKGRHKGLVER